MKCSAPSKQQNYYPKSLLREGNDYTAAESKQRMSSCKKRNTNILLQNYNLCRVITAYVKSVGGMPAKHKTGTKNFTFMYTDRPADSAKGFPSSAIKPLTQSYLGLDSIMTCYYTGL